MRMFEALPHSLAPCILILRHCDAFVISFTAAKLRALYSTSIDVGSTCTDMYGYVLWFVQSASPPAPAPPFKVKWEG
ncbi:hypothetical protein EVAR_26667_1 [Eumeta japonica]|uniref:Uncharacterized protein n=1 Tax=Eumeta variegata TaxID=151549 RepID=A0A4C1VP94_EUMVA|nr:hypothetical protein EVAR_26667_1 [Eumeta japonica]